MGGLGSGRSSGFGRRTVEGSLSLDCNKLHRDGCLREEYSGSYKWGVENDVVASISMHGHPDRLNLDYRIRDNDGLWQEISESVVIQRVPCRYGGSRPYFICPGIVNGCACGRRVVKLYGAGRYFRCRHCWGLGYASQREGIWDRSRRRRDKLRQRLGGRVNDDGLLPVRPKGMWQRTYVRLSEQLWEAEVAADAAFALHAGQLLASLGSKPNKARPSTSALGPIPDIEHVGPLVRD